MKTTSTRIAFTLLGVSCLAHPLLADSPFKPKQASFSTKPADSTSVPPPAIQQVSSVTPVKEVTRPAPLTEKMPASFEQQFVPAKREAVDLSFKAASVEVAWLQEPATYPLHLRADQQPGQEVVVLTGFVPSDRLREKAVAIAKQTLGTVTLLDQLVVHSQMALPMEVTTAANQAHVLQDSLERVIPGITRGLQLSVDQQGVASILGKIDSFEDRRKIIRALQGIPGCTSIHYDLRVTATTPAEQVTVVPIVVTGAVKEVTAPPVPVPVPVPPAKVEANFPKPLGGNTTKSPSPVLKQVGAVKTDDKAVIQADVSEKAAGSKSTANLTSSSLSGLLPPVSSEPAESETLAMIRLGSPTIVRTSFDINLDVMSPPPVTSSRHVTKPIAIGSSSLVPTGQATSAETLTVMPREGK